MPYRQIIAAAYNAGAEEEYNRLNENSAQFYEYQLISSLLDNYVSSGSIVVDVGSGPGRYAEYLLKHNCKVGLVDLSVFSLKAFSDRIGSLSYKECILFNKVSCASQLQWIKNCFADVVLLMGPMYHLVNEEHRNLALSHCKRILKPGGFLFMVFLYPLQKVQGSTNSAFPDTYVNIELLLKSHLKPSKTYTVFQGYNVPQFRCHPLHAKELITKNGFETISFHNLECDDSKSNKDNRQFIYVARN